MKLKYIIIALFGILFSSCEDFLDKKPSTSLGTEDAITTMTDLRNAVNGIAYSMTTNRMTYAADFAILSDLFGADFAPKGAGNHISPAARYQLTKNDDIPYYAYYYFYRALARVNSVLSAVDNITYKESEKAKYNDYIGQLKAWRAMLHFDVARIFCNAPTASDDVNAANSGIVLSTAVYAPGYVAPRTTLKETYDQILKDYEEALSLLSKEKNPGYINYWAALALRSRVHLYYGNNAEALRDAQEVIEGKVYSLYTIDNYVDVWRLEYTTESLFEVSITSAYNPQRNSAGYYCDASGYGECAFVEGENTLLDYLQNNTSDVRSKLVKNQTTGTYPGIYPAKYPGRDGLYVNSPKIIRLSEVYLIAAEAALKSGASTAADYMNTLRTNRIEGYQDVNTVTLADILEERRIELFAEGHNAWDYWRNRLSVNNLAVGEINYNDYRAIFPIPQQEIDIAPGILVQNPKY